jgi:hypothetical protein
MADTLAVGSYEVRQADQKIPARGQVGNKSTKVLSVRRDLL